MRRNCFFTILLLMIGFASVPGLARPAQVLIIRHAEKLDDDNNHLSPRGRERAEALVGMFLGEDRFSKHGKPAAIFAASIGPDGSVRSIETVEPLSNALDLKTDSSFHSKDVEGIVDEIFKSEELNDRTVVICWSHDDIPELARAFGVTDPPKWHKETFDKVWSIEFDQNQKIDFKEFAQHLLPGDD
jgi:hypothetical protein